MAAWGGGGFFLAFPISSLLPWLLLGTILNGAWCWGCNQWSQPRVDEERGGLSWHCALHSPSPFQRLTQHAAQKVQEQAYSTARDPQARTGESPPTGWTLPLPRNRTSLANEWDQGWQSTAAILVAPTIEPCTVWVTYRHSTSAMQPYLLRAKS